MSNDNKPARQRFGRYLILDHLVDGGMAKICRARFLGEQADKIVAIKMVQPKFSQDESFKTMFMDEIKVTFGLQHPNIVQTYDYGIQDEQLYVAMEYCDGRNLKEYLDKLKKRGYIFPIEISVYIISQACQGLYYAHTLTDKLTGKEANIIHRDISPHNVMLTYDGAIKVIDFGIAKAETNSEATQAGTIKGKLSYLAPEYLEGMELDPRYDQFAIGITLWEMLCSRKLFKAANDLAVLKKIQECRVPAPSSINPIVPKELDEIVLKALSKDRNRRFNNLNELNKALTKFLYSYKPDFNATDLAYFAKELFKEEITKDREKLFSFGKIDLKPYLEDLKDEQNGGGKSRPAKKIESSSEDDDIKVAKPTVLDFGFEEENDKLSLTALSSKKQAVEKGKVEARAGKKAPKKLEIASPGAKKVPSAGTKTDATNSSARVNGNKTGTKVKIKNKSKSGKTRTVLKRSKNAPDHLASSSPAKSAALIASLVFALYLFRDKYKDPVVKLLGKDHTVVTKLYGKVHTIGDPSDSGQNKVNRKAASVGKLKLIGIKDRHKQRAYVDGKNVKIDFLGQVDVPLGQTFFLRVQTSGRKHFVKKLKVTAGSSDESVVIPSELDYMDYGYLVNKTNCLQGTLEFTLFGEKRVEKLPISRGVAFPLAVSADGEYTARTHEIYYVRNDGIKKRISFKISKKDDTIDICEL